MGAIVPGQILPTPGAPRIGARTLVMGILNLTPDSFSGDGLGSDLDGVLARAEALIAAGADILDLGGESTRPGHTQVSEEEELARVVPAVERLAGRVSVPVSIDTRKAAVAEAALAAGATIVNDVSGLDFDPCMANVAARSGAALVLGHWRQRRNSDPDDLIAWIAAGLRECIIRAAEAGVPRTRLLIDPGLGFAKVPPWSMEVIRRLPELRARLGLPLVIGASRKGFIGRLLDRPAEDRLAGSLAAAVVSIAHGADMVRVHDVAATVRAVTVADALVRGWDETPQRRTPVYLGVGANLGDRAGAIAAAIQHLSEESGLRVIRRSTLYETAPYSVTDQPAFLNAVIEAETTLSPQRLLDALQQVERLLGRQRRERWGPREIDVDLLLYGQEQVVTPNLIVPHPGLWERLFVVAPLAELCPDLHAPDGATLADVRARLAASQEAHSLGW
ncbi:MAG: dihydropteroate synthase [Chloroflexi bacterium]|nr:dihydropteroate synthase [Chloroflexota bacterium]